MYEYKGEHGKSQLFKIERFSHFRIIVKFTFIDKYKTLRRLLI